DPSGGPTRCQTGHRLLLDKNRPAACPQAGHRRDLHPVLAGDRSHAPRPTNPTGGIHYNNGSWRCTLMAPSKAPAATWSKTAWPPRAPAGGSTPPKPSSSSAPCSPTATSTPTGPTTSPASTSATTPSPAPATSSPPDAHSKGNAPMAHRPRSMGPQIINTPV